MGSLPDRDKRRNSMDRVRGITGMVMGLVYFFVAALVIYAQKIAMIQVGDTFSYLIATLMVAYGAFRIYRGWMIHKNAR
jgi:hypothetical protein